MSDYLKYPLTGFHFSVMFDIFPDEIGFQDVSGLSFEIEYEPAASGGFNTNGFRLPKRPKYQDLVLKRGLGIASGISAWVIDAAENFKFKPTNILISLLNEYHMPLSSWYVVNALPLKWDISPFNAEEGKIVIETMTLKYDYFKTLNLSAAIAGAVDAIFPIKTSTSNLSVP